MATVSTSPRTNRITLASSSAGPFLVGFRLFAADGLDVYINGVRQAAGFTVAATFLNGFDDNAAVTFGSALPLGTVIQFDGALTPGRAQNYANPDPLLTQKINTELGRLWSSVSDLNQLVRRSVRGLDPLDAVDGISAQDLADLPSVLASSSAAAQTATSAAQTATQARDQVLAIQDSLPEWRGPWVTARAYGLGDLVSQVGSSYICTIAHTSGTFSTDLSAGRWQIFAQQGAAGAGTGDMLAANNLSDVANVATARSNLGLGPVATDSVVPVSRGGTGVTTISAARALFGGAAQSDNRIINGCFDIWQTGTSSTTGTWSADQWNRFNVGGTLTVTRENMPLGTKFGMNNPRFFLRASVTGQSAANHYAIIGQPLEDVRTYAGETITILGWVRRSSGAGNMVVSLTQVFGVGGSPTVGTLGGLITLTSDWQPFAQVINVPSVSGKVLGTEGTDYVRPQFWISAGTNEISGIPGFGLQTIGVDFEGVHIRRGSFTAAEALNYVQAPVEEELFRCQRFYEKSYDQSVVPGTAGSNPGAVYTQRAQGNALEAIERRFAVPKRATPNMTIFARATGASGNVTNDGTSANVAVSSTVAGQAGFFTQYTAATGTPYSFHFVADARLPV